MSLSKNLKRIRKENNLSQEQLADKLGVSRQAVSKWESGQAYPEMEKMLIMCKMFNLNIDELLNQDIGEINETRQSRNNINKYIEDFLGLVTKTIDMFSSMSFKTKIKCIFEQFIVFCILFIIIMIIGSIGAIFVQDILMIFPDKVYYVIYTIIEDIYLILGIILGSVLLLHIFKVRYLDYYVINRDIEENEEIKTSEISNYIEQEKEHKIYLEKKPTKIIIRDPENAGSKFISLLFRGVLFCVKIFALMFGSIFCFSLVGLFVLLVLAFMFVKTGEIFIGAILAIISVIIMNLGLLNILYNFIISKKSRMSRLGVYFCLSLIMLGVGIGLFFSGMTEFDIVSNNEIYEDELIVPWREDLTIHRYDVNYIESDNTDVRIIYRYSKYYEMDIDYYDNDIFIRTYVAYDNVMEVIRDHIDNINNKEIVDYGYLEIDVYTTKENIEKLNNNYYHY